MTHLSLSFRNRNDNFRPLPRIAEIYSSTKLSARQVVYIHRLKLRAPRLVGKIIAAEVTKECRRLIGANALSARMLLQNVLI